MVGRGVFKSEGLAKSASPDPGVLPMRIGLWMTATGCLIGALALPVPSTFLAEAEAAATTGSVLIDGRRCNHASADCQFYNQVNGIVFPCPTGSGLCSQCEINGPWDTCVQSTASARCNWLGNGNNCGALLQGACDGDECVIVIPLSVCVKAPRCR